MNATLPDMLHVKRQHAIDLATAIAAFLHEWPTKATIYLNAAGEFALLIGCVAPIPPDEIVGTYDGSATTGQIVDDLMASQRERIA